MLWLFTVLCFAGIFAITLLKTSIVPVWERAVLAVLLALVTLSSTMAIVRQQWLNILS